MQKDILLNNAITVPANQNFNQPLNCKTVIELLLLF